MAEVNSKIRTLWTVQVRVTSSEDVVDALGGLKRGRIDIPEEAAVVAEGYSKVEFRANLSDGSVTTAGNYKDLLTKLNGAVMSFTGSGVMTAMIDAATAGVLNVEVYKEWEVEGADPDPEGEGMPEDFAGIVRNFRLSSSGQGAVTLEQWNGERWNSTSWGPSWIANWIANSLENASAPTLERIKKALGITATPEA